MPRHMHGGPNSLVVRMHARVVVPCPSLRPPLYADHSRLGSARAPLNGGRDGGLRGVRMLTGGRWYVFLHEAAVVVVCHVLLPCHLMRLVWITRVGYLVRLVLLLL